MKKIRLDMEALEVVSFVADTEPRAQRGTVHGRGTRDPYYFTGDSCYGDCQTWEYNTCQFNGPTQGPSCEEMCGAWTVGCTTPETCP